MTLHNITIMDAGTMGGGNITGSPAVWLPTPAIDATDAAPGTLHLRIVR